MGVDATDLFDRYDEDFEEMPGGGFPHIEINKMHISQSIEVQQNTRMYKFLHSTLLLIWARVLLNTAAFLQAPLTNSDTAVLSGSLSTHNGNGGGNINMTVRRVMSARGWGEVRTHAHTNTKYTKKKIEALIQYTEAFLEDAF